jgi:hypothetical protein
MSGKVGNSPGASSRRSPTSRRRLTLRQADQAREDFAAMLDELEFVKYARGPSSTPTVLTLRQSARFPSVGAIHTDSRFKG